MSKLRDRRHRHDPFYQRAKRESFAARSVYKLQEIEQRFGLLRGGQRVLDLGCRPGSWLQHAAARVGPHGYVVGVDRKPLDVALPENANLVVGDILSIDPLLLLAALPEGGGCFQVILSDLAPDTSGVPFTDQVRSLELFTRAMELAQRLGCPRSALLGKLFMGEGFQEILSELKQRYEEVKVVRPTATRRSSTEVYLLGLRRRS